MSDRPTDPPPSPEATDLASLLSAEAAEKAAQFEAEGRLKRARETRARAPKTDFATLSKDLPAPVKRPLHRTITDFLLLGFAPTLVFVMVTSVVMFLLDVRYVYTEVNDLNLRWVAFFFLVGIVALNRLVARDGQEESMLYAMGLAAAIGLYTVATTTMYEMGSVVRGFLSSPVPATLFNMTLVAFLWWMTNRLTHECCVDENPTAGEIGILTGTLRKFAWGVRTRARDADTPPTPDVYDPIEGWKPKAKKLGDPKDFDERMPRRHPGMSIFYFSVPVLAIFALGQRVVMHGGDPMIMAGHFYIGVYTVSALLLLMMTSLSGLRAYFRARFVTIPSGLAPFWLGLGIALVAVITIGATALPLPSLPRMAIITSHQTDFWTQNSTFRLAPVAATPVEILEQARFMHYAGRAVLVMLGLFLAYGTLRTLGFFAAEATRNPRRYPPAVKRALQRADRVLERLGQLPRLPRINRRPRISREIALSARYRNPLSEPAAASRSTAELVAYTYDALCALAQDLGTPRSPSQTPYEFMEAFPAPLQSLRDEAFELTRLLVQADYAGQPLDDRDRDRLRAFWITYNRVRARFVR